MFNFFNCYFTPIFSDLRQPRLQQSPLQHLPPNLAVAHEPVRDGPQEAVGCEAAHGGHHSLLHLHDRKNLGRFMVSTTDIFFSSFTECNLTKCTFTNC
jgi:hypothetical protein